MSKRQLGGVCRGSRTLATVAVAVAVGLGIAGLIINAGAGTAQAATPTASSTSVKPLANVPPQVEYINEMIRKGWTDNKLTPSAMATDGEWCRRVYLDVIGRIPRLDELNHFLTDKTANRKAALVDRLLGDEYDTEYAENWSTIWTNLLIGRAGKPKDDAKSPTSREGMSAYLRQAFGHNKPYNKMVYELISATGTTKPGEEGYNGATNFLVGKMDDDGKATLATAKTAQIFLGLSVQCTQCHNHPFNDWKQNQFWEMNAFFRQTHIKKTMAAKKKVEYAALSDTDFRGESSTGDPHQAVLFYELRNGNEKASYPVFVDGTEISRSGLIADVDRRTELAKLIVKSDYMSKAIVNRMWGHFMGYAFTKPVDDMGPHNAPTHPELLDKMAKDFSNHRYEDDGYDLKQLIRWIVLSEPYGLSSHYSKSNRGDDPTLGEKPKFSHFYLRQMSAEQLYESLLAATALDKARGNDDERAAVKSQWLQQFVIAFGTDDGGETSTFNGSIPQALMMFNGEMMKRATSGEAGTFLASVADNSRLSSADKISYLYMAALARKPSSAELAALEANANGVGPASPTTSSTNGGGGGRRGPMGMRPAPMGGGARMGGSTAYQDLWWSLLNSNEFIINH